LKEGFFKYSAEEAAIRLDRCGKNDKEKQDLKKKRSDSAGIAKGISNCGITVDIYELFGSEGCSQVSNCSEYVLCNKNLP
jgi:hypothetical protein